jgi:hypothetical protein
MVKTVRWFFHKFTSNRINVVGNIKMFKSLLKKPCHISRFNLYSVARFLYTAIEGQFFFFWIVRLWCPKINLGWIGNNPDAGYIKTFHIISLKIGLIFFLISFVPCVMREIFIWGLSQRIGNKWHESHLYIGLNFYLWVKVIKITINSLLIFIFSFLSNDLSNWFNVSILPKTVKQNDSTSIVQHHTDLIFYDTLRFFHFLYFIKRPH